ncbi:MAG: hypothetical protein ABL855_04275, partial [Sideroxydans sp.]
VEAEDMDSAQILNVARPWLGDVKTVDTDWSVGRSLLFQEFLVTADAKNSECGLYSAAINAEEIGV